MNDAAALGRLNVFRCLMGHLQSRYGVGLVLVHRSDGPARLPTYDDSALGALAAALAELPDLQQQHLGALIAAREARDGTVIDHPFGFRMLACGCPVGGEPGRLVILPFMVGEDVDSARSRLKISLRRAGLRAAAAERISALTPLMSKRDVAHLLELGRVLSAETADYNGQLQQAERRLDRLRKRTRSRYPRIIGQSLPMHELFSLLDKVVQTDSTVYLHGENGTGKELVAREIHEHSHRGHQPFIIQNCSALNDNLLESELFGHVRGAFTGAIAEKPGLFELADQGSFFLDEIGDMSPALQVKLLRVLQEGSFSRVGDIAVRRVDVRVICATNRDLKRMVDDGTFREDLYYRINVINLRIPPLRERRDDIPTLVEWFLQRAMLKAGNPSGRKRLSKDALGHLVEYDWPGNVRELENEIERLVALAGPLVTSLGQDLLSHHIRMRPLTSAPRASASGVSLPDALERMERAMIYERLKEARWNKTKAAEALGISRRNLIRKVDKYGFEKRSE